MVKKIDNLIGRLVSYDIYNKGLALARTSLAVSTLLSLFFNPPATLFNPVLRKLNGEILLRNSFLENVNLFKLLYPFSPLLGTMIAVFILLLVISGWRPRITGILHFWVSYSFLNAAALIDGGDQINSNICLLLIPITLLDYRKNHWRCDHNNFKPASLIVSNVSFFVICIQVSLIYFQAGTSKLGVGQWANGTAVYYWLIDPNFGLDHTQFFLLRPLITKPVVIACLTWGTIFVEVLLFAAIFMRHRYYRSLFIMGVCLHLSFLVFIGLFSFFFSILGALLLYLYVPALNYSKAVAHEQNS